MSELSERVTEDPSNVTVGELDELVGEAVDDPDGPATEALSAVLEAEPDRAATVGAALADRLDADRPAVELGSALFLLREFAELHPEEAAPLAPTVFDVLDHEHPTVEDRAVRALEPLGTSNTTAVADRVDAVEEMLADDRVVHRAVGVELAVALAEDDPGAAGPLLDGLLTVAETEYESPVQDADPNTLDISPGPPGEQPQALVDDDRQQRMRHDALRERAAVGIALLAEHDPGALAPHAASVGEAIDATDWPVLQYGLVDALAPVAEAHPEDAMVALDPLVDSLDPDIRSQDRARAALALSFLADADEQRVADAVEDRLDAVLDLLEADEPEVQSAGAGLLMYVGEQSPDRVAEATDLLLDMLDAEDPSVRGSAAWVLGIAGDEDARDRLQAVAESDPDEEVRSAAEQALTRL